MIDDFLSGILRDPERFDIIVRIYHIYLTGKKMGDVHEFLYWYNADPKDAKHRHLSAVRWKNWRLLLDKKTQQWKLFDLKNDPDEMCNVADVPAYVRTRNQLTRYLISRLYGSDLEWLDGDRLVGLPDREWQPQPDRGLGNQRGWRFI